MTVTPQQLPKDLYQYISDQAFPCIAAKAALAKDQIQYFEASSIHCPAKDREILDFLHAFVDQYKGNQELYQSAIIIFNREENGTEEMFEASFWRRLQSLSTMDAAQYGCK